MNDTVKRIEVTRITRVTTDEIDNLPGIYCVYCPKTGFTKFGRASKLRDRLQDYNTMCLNGGGVVIMTKTMSPRMIVCAEETLLSIATTRLEHVDKNEYFLCESEDVARKILDDSLAYLTRYYVTLRDIMQPLLDDLSKAVSNSETVEDFQKQASDFWSAIFAGLRDAKQAEHMEIYYLTKSAAIEDE
jgi:hypothetical protein